MLDIQNLIENPEMLSGATLAELRELTERYPFFQVARILYVRNLYNQHSPEFGNELRKASVFVPDRSTLFAFSEGTHYEIETSSSQDNTPGAGAGGNRTISLIENFLDQSKSQELKPSTADLINDYSAFLMKLDNIETEDDIAVSDDMPQLRGAHLIDSFIQETKGKQRVEMQPYEEDKDFISPVISDEEEEIYTENMVNIYIKQGRYEQALEILRKICLTNPKKNTNFAAQMNLLEVIIASGKQN